MSDFVECNVVVLTCGDVRKIPVGEAVERGYSNGFCTVLFASPPKCIITNATKIRYGSKCEYSEESLTNNILITEKCNGSRKVYAYPKKVYELLKKLYILPVAEGRSPYSNGLLLAGAPGTGKTAMAKIMARMLGIEPTMVRPDNVLSKYVGESEKRIRNIFAEAKKNLPSVIIFDDSDVFLSARTLASTHTSEQYLRNIQQIIFDEMQSISDSKLPLLIIATTNVKTSEIDQAFLRGGRFGDPIYIPLPDEEAMFYVLKEILSESEARELSRKLVNAGLSMADAIDYAVKKKTLGIEEIPSRSGRGYSRVSVDIVPDFERAIPDYIKKILRSGTLWRIHIPEIPEIGVAIGVQIAYWLRRPPIWVTDERYLDEAVHITNMLEGLLIASTTMSPFSISYILFNAKTPVIFAGETPVSSAYTVPLGSLMYSLESKILLIKAVANFKNVKIPMSLERKLRGMMLNEKLVESILHYIISTGYIDEHVIDNLNVLYR